MFSHSNWYYNKDYKAQVKEFLVMKGFDTPDALTFVQCKDAKDKGFGWVGRYYSYPHSWKALTKSEAQRISDNGLYNVVVYERDPITINYFKRPDIVKIDLDYALLNASTVNQPKETAIYFATDYDCQPDQLELIGDYYEGIDIGLKAHGYQNGAYGNGLLLHYLLGRGVISKTWLSESKDWQGYDLVAEPNIRQIVSPKITLGGSLVDIDLDESSADPALNGAGGWKL